MAIKLSTSYTRQSALTHLLFSQSHLIGSVRTCVFLGHQFTITIAACLSLSLSNNSASSNYPPKPRLVSLSFSLQGRKRRRL
jgi:hypothetical protein